MAIPLDELTQQQATTGAEIERWVSNYKRDGNARKTTAYLISKMDNLVKLWDTFESTNESIKAEYGDQKDHKYFKTNYFEGIRKIYTWFVEDVERRKTELEQQAAEAILTEQGASSDTEDIEKRTNKLEKQKAITTEKLFSDPPEEVPTIEAMNRLRAAVSSMKSIITNQKAEDTEDEVPLNPALRRLRAAVSSIKHTMKTIKQTGSAQSRAFFQVKYKLVEQQWSNIERLNEAVWEHIENPASEGYKVDEYFALQDQVQNILIDLQQGSNHHSNSLATATDNSPQVRLPKISIPKFDGNYLNWKSFHDLFLQMVHLQALANSQKMWYLKASLTGEAERLVHHLDLSDDNYESAWKILQDRYNNKRLLVTALLSKLLNHPSITNESTNAIKSLHDVTLECVCSLKNLKVSTEGWDPLLLHLLIKKLDSNTHALYEQGLKDPRSLQSLEEFLSFLEKRFQSLESLGAKTQRGVLSEQRSKPNTARSLAAASQSNSGCIACRQDHQLFECKSFLRLNPRKRYQLVQGSKLCINCLKPGHVARNCSSRHCTRCSRKHNTLLHYEETTLKSSSKVESASQPTSSISPSHSVTTEGIPATTLSANVLEASSMYVLLGTVVLNIADKDGKLVEARAILDSGSQLNLISEKLARRLGLQARKHTVYIEGIGLKKQDTHNRVNIHLFSMANGYNANIEAQILPKIIAPQPSQTINHTSWPIPSNVKLADPQFHKPGPIDVLIGAELFYATLSIGQISLGEKLPLLQNTLFGWTIAGRIDNTPLTSSLAYCGICTEEEQTLDAQIRRFWEIEEVEVQGDNLTLAEAKCEKFFVHTTERDTTGRFIVRLPFKADPKALGESCETALNRFHSLERRLAKHPELRKQYIDFMREYLQLNHMEEVQYTMIEEPYFFFPHHCVLKPTSTTTKLRVVFDGSAKTTSHISLNDILAAGPRLQDDVFTQILRFRLPLYVFTADVEKMYRQIKIHPEDRKYQLIWWREDISSPMKCFQLKTITYGTTPGTYLATRCLHKLADDEMARYPLAARMLKQDFYVDDLMSGSNNLTTAIQMQAEIISVLRSAGMKIRKWCANNPSLLQNILKQDQALEADFNDLSNDSIKTMGLTWEPKTDNFSVRTCFPLHQKITKRTTSSDIAHIFDPLGILAPVVITAKLFLQRLWELKLDWDAALPQNLHTTWIRFREGLHLLNNITFPRHIFSHEVPRDVQIHVFADASERAYGAAAYIRALNQKDTIIVRLLCAKSKVAPTKQITLPRLELCAAKLAAQLLHRLEQDLALKTAKKFLWTDSMIVLGWINAESSNFHTFVANRIAAIQRLTIPEQWRHVSSPNNPADLLSRGVLPDEFSAKTIWFFGPTFLHGSENIWPAPYENSIPCKEERRTNSKATCASTKIQEDSTIFDSIDHQNSWRRVQRIIAYVHRFINRCKRKVKGPKSLSVQELEASLTSIVRYMQESEFKDDINHIRTCKEVARNSSLSSLTPFLDDNGLLRVGGRLEASTLTYNAKHPILLPYSHPYTKLILVNLHKENMHPGPQTLLSIARQTFWPLKGKNLTRSVVQQCVQCARANPKLLSQLMGNLPADRVQPARPFVISGVDFCGPVFTHFKIRGKRPLKAYIAVFCCFSSKAIHLELVTDLSTEGFIGALRRFIARRGRCKRIYCDNATNFVGARNQLQDLKTVFYDSYSRQKIEEACGMKGIEFHFIPPRAPHFGGLWESAVKSAKHLLKHSLAAAALTYEEMETIVVEAEAILNSRPLTPLSDNANDFAALTPAHLLIGEPLTSAVDDQAKPLKVSGITRWKMVAHIKNEFWKRWSNDYLNQLQHRYKWKRPVENVKPGTMVIIKEDNLPPLKWPLGRIVNVIKGEDQLVRVVDVKTATNVLRRPIHRLAPLPIEEETDQNTLTDEDPGSSIAEKRSIEQQQQSSPLIKKPKRSLGQVVMATLLTCLLLPIAKAYPGTVTLFDRNPGIYFEGLGPANIISSKWDIVTYYDMQPYWKELSILHEASSTLATLAAEMNKPSAFAGIVIQIKQIIHELDEANDLIRESGHRRIKRGAFNIIGNIANGLFGVLDSQYAEGMSKKIEELHENEDNLATLLKNQTIILDTTANIMKRNHLTIQEEFKRVESHVNQISSQIRDSLHEEQLAQSFTALAFQTLLTITNFQRTQNMILDVLASTQHGRVSRNLISPRQLRDILKTIRINLSTSLKLPINPDDPLKYYDILSLEGRATDKHLVFRVQLPLISSEDFELFNIIPIPVKVNGSFVAIRASFPFLIVNLHRDHYWPLSEPEVKTCAITEGRYLCNQRNPLYKIGSSIGACEMRLLNQMNPSSTCQIIRMPQQSTWIQMHKANHWIFSVSEETTINLVCGENMTQLTLQGTGILKINGDCIIKQPYITIHGQRIYHSVNRASYVPSLNLTGIVTNQTLADALQYQHQYDPHLGELADLKRRIQEISYTLPMKLQAHNTHHYSLGYICLTLIICMVTVATLRHLLRKTARTRDTAGERDTSNPEDHADSGQFVISLDTAAN